MKDVIIIGADHYNTLWLVRSLGLAGFSPIALIVDRHSHKSFVSKSKYCTKCLFADTLDDVVPTLLSLNYDKKTVIIASGDPVAEVLDRNYNILSEKYILHNCEDKEGGIVHWMDKDNMLAMAKECSLVIPYTRKLNLYDEIDFNGFPYPCLIKPEVSAESSKNIFRICQNAEELIHSLNEVKDICPNVILQEYIKPVFECLLYGVSTDKEVLLPGALHKIHTCSDTNNLGMASFAYLSTDMPSQLGDITKVKNFVRRIGFHGVFSVEFMITENKAYFLEINLRNDGTCYITTQAGVNIPAIWTATSYGIPTNIYPHTFKRKRTYGMNEINYLKYTLKRVGLIQMMKDINRTNAFSIFMFSDIKPSLYKLIYH